jgi:hypothetical protein
VIVRPARRHLALAAVIIAVSGCGGRAANSTTVSTGTGAQRSTTATLQSAPPAIATATALAAELPGTCTR